MYEVVKTVNGVSIWRMIGTRGFYHVNLRPGVQRTFRTIKAAVAFIRSITQ